MSRRAGLLVAAAATLFALVTTAVGAASGAPAEFLITDLVTGSTFIVAGLVAVWLRPASPAGPLLLVSGALWFVGSYAPSGRPVVMWLGFAFEAYYDLALAALLLMVSSPAGRLAPKPLIAGLAIAMGVRSAGRLLLQSPELIPDCGDCLPPNPFALWPNLAAFEAVEVASNIAIGGLVTAIGIVALRRLLRAGPLVRRARAPILLAGGVAMSASAYDTFEYAWSTATGSLFLEPSEPWATLISWMWFGARTLVPIGFLLATLRLRSQPGPLGRLAAGLDTSGGEASVGEALRLALGDPSLVMLRPDGAGSGWRDEAGNPAELPSTGAARSMTRIGSVEAPLAMLVHDPALVDQPELVAAVSRVLGLALENERLEAELRKQLAEVTASRERIVTATEEERRRIERDLHDGAQQRLVALAMRLEAARGTSADARALIDATTSELGTAIAEVRNLARGIHPPILTEAGLRAAIDSLAERAPLPIEVDADDQRYPEQIEATAYFVAAEALTNVARHANASHARVTIRRENGTLVLEIADDGRGGADAVRGSGLSGLEDRVAATRGALEVESRDGTGTTLRVRLPLEVAGA